MRVHWRSRGAAIGALLSVVGATALVAAASGASAAPALSDLPASPAEAHRTGDGSCALGPDGQIKHVISLVFDNVHLSRDNPNVPSDLEQMPHLLNFLRANGTVSGNNHTPLIAHTATDILTGLTGLYGDRHGVGISNSYRYFLPTGASHGGSSFTYWTDPIFDTTTQTPSATDPKPNMIGQNGKIAPAPWVPYTRAGCNVGQVATANAVIENVTADIPTIFGTSSPEYQQLKSDPNSFKDPEVANYEGIAVHCARGAALCASGNRGVPDVLPTEPGGYTGYQALFGHKYVAPHLTPDGSQRLVDLNGNEIDNPFTHTAGFPGFDGMNAATSLSYVASMQERGVPVTYGYLSDLHDNHSGGNAFGPGEAGYVAQLKTDDQAFATFLQRLANDGINKSNTLFAVTADEGDHFAGIRTKTGCDGVTTPCVYGPNQIGELSTNLTGLLATERGNTTPLAIHSDSAPNIYVTGQPAPTAPVVRTLERDLAGLTANNPYSGVANERVVNYLADPVEEKLLHITNSDPQRTPTVTAFAKPDYFLFTGAPNCASACVSINPGFAWNHGDVAPDINRTWLALVGPGIKVRGQTDQVWSDHTDLRPTMLAALGLRDDYREDGRVLVEFLSGEAVPESLRDHADTVGELGRVYKQLNASVGKFGLSTLAASTGALVSGTATDDSRYTHVEAALTRLGARRDAVAHQISSLLWNAAFAHQAIDNHDGRELVEQANRILRDAAALAKTA